MSYTRKEDCILRKDVLLPRPTEMEHYSPGLLLEMSMLEKGWECKRTRALTSSHYRKSHQCNWKELKAFKFFFFFFFLSFFFFFFFTIQEYKLVLFNHAQCRRTSDLAVPGWCAHPTWLLWLWAELAEGRQCCLLFFLRVYLNLSWLFFFFSFFSFLITKGRSENVLFHITNVFGFYSNGILRFLFSRENETEAIACIF